MVLNDLEGSSASERKNAGVMNGQHSVLKTLIALKQCHTQAHFLAATGRQVASVGFCERMVSQLLDDSNRLRSRVWVILEHPRNKPLLGHLV